MINTIEVHIVLPNMIGQYSKLSNRWSFLKMYKVSFSYAYTNTIKQQFICNLCELITTYCISVRCSRSCHHTWTSYTSDRLPVAHVISTFQNGLLIYFIHVHKWIMFILLLTKLL